MAFVTLGCKVNRTESDTMAGELLGRAIDVTGEAPRADVVVINTCTVTAEADAKARKAVRHALGMPLAPVVVVTGCLAAIDAPGLRELGERVVVEADKAAVAARVARLLGIRGAAVATVDRVARGGPEERMRTASTTRVMIKVEDGCDNACAYCIVPRARGVPRAAPAARVIGDVRALVAAGTREIVLTGINIGRYRDPSASGPASASASASAAGRGEETAFTDLPALLGLLVVTGIPRIRLSSIEPPDVTPRFLHVFARHQQVMPHLHVPLQSGSDRILSAMGRAYSTADFARIVTDARAALPHLAITTDVIVGFPGETDADHAASLAFVEACAFAKLHVFRYSRRPGTPAADMPGQVDPRTKVARAAEMRALGARLAAAWALAHTGQRAHVLVESADLGARTAQGTSEDYLRVVIKRSNARRGDVVRVRISGPAPTAHPWSPASVTAVEDPSPVVESN